MAAEPRLAYQIHPGDGPCLGLLHGFLSSSAQWMLNLPALADVCRPVTIELWGHGNSPAPDDPTCYTPHHYVEQLEMIRADLGVEKWLLCGYSLGAGLTMRYAQAHPEALYGHLLTNSQSGFADQAQIDEWRATDSRSAAGILRGGLAAIEKIPVHPRHARRLPEPVKKQLLLDADRLQPVGVARCVEHTTTSVSMREHVSFNTVPALLCHGIHERRFEPTAAWAQQHMANLEVIELDAGHAVNMEDADGFNQAVSNFVQQVCG